MRINHKQSAGLVLLAVGALSGCAAIQEVRQEVQQSEVFRDARDMVGKAVNTLSGEAKAIKQRMQRYVKDKALLEKFHDAAAHSESALLSVLHQSRLPASGQTGGDGKPGTRPGASPRRRTEFPLPEKYSGDMRWPLDAGIVSSEYGARWGKAHKGIDIAADVGEPVHAVADGVVIYADDKMSGYGNVVILQHDDQTTTFYAHNSEMKVAADMPVKRGEVIALVGNTGRSTGPHTHFEIRVGDEAVDPRTLLPEKKKFAEDGNIAEDPDDAPAAAPR
ncbi:MAG: M23 family metallopeptidase [Panacagrimonas sp.]